MKADYQILIVDDDESIRRMLAAVLAREGFQTVTAAAPPARGPALLRELLMALLPAGADMAVHWCDPRLQSGQVATPGAADGSSPSRSIEI